MKKTTLLVLSFFVALIAYGCATIMHGTSQNIGISSSPSGANVIIDNKPLGRSPLFANLSRSDNHIIRIELDGYMPAELTVTRKVSGWVWGNIVFGGLIGLAVDAISGGLYTLTPEQLQGELRKAQASFINKKNTIIVVTVLQPNKNWIKIANLNKLN